MGCTGAAWRGGGERKTAGLKHGLDRCLVNGRRAQPITKPSEAQAPNLLPWGLSQFLAEADLQASGVGLPSTPCSAPAADASRSTQESERWGRAPTKGDWPSTATTEMVSAWSTRMRARKGRAGVSRVVVTPLRARLAAASGGSRESGSNNARAGWSRGGEHADRHSRSPDVPREGSWR
jgi:hypothetical protein